MDKQPSLTDRVGELEYEQNEIRRRIWTIETSRAKAITLTLRILLYAALFTLGLLNGIYFSP